MTPVDPAPLGRVFASIPEVPGASLSLRGCEVERSAVGGEQVELALPPQDCALRLYAERWDADAFGAAVDVSIRPGGSLAIALPAPPDDAWLPLADAPTPPEDARMDALEARWIAIEDALASLPTGCPETARLEAMGLAAEVADQQLALEAREPFLLPSQEALAEQIGAAVSAASEICGSTPESARIERGER